MDKYIPSHNYIKNMRSTLEVPELQILCEVDCISEPLIELQSRQLWSLIQFEWMSRQWNQISLICVRRQQKLLCFFQLHSPVKLSFNDITTFKNQARIPTSTRRRHQVMCVTDHKPLFRETGETNSETRFSLKFVNVGDEQKFPKTSVCIILVDLVYLESAKIYTGSKIVRGLKRLRTTGLSHRRIQGG